MIQPQELRIGNLLQNFLGEIFEVNLMTLQNIISGNWGEFGEPKYIPLTEEILLKCGFEFNDSSHYQTSKPSIFIEELRYVYNINDFEIILFKGIYYYNNIEVKYLHQLQNLYFALTGEELTFK